MSFFDDLDAWLRATAQASQESGEGFDLTRLESNEISELATDLEGIADSANQLRLTIHGLVEGEPSADDLETHLVEIETDLKHALWHWRSLRQVLHGKQLWSDDDESEAS